MNGDVIVPITFIAAIFGLLYLYLKSRHRERITMIEKGVTADTIDDKARTVAATLKMGMLCVGVGLGILMGYLVERIFDPHDNTVFYFAFIFLFGGLALILNYKIEIKRTHSF